MNKDPIAVYEHRFDAHLQQVAGLLRDHLRELLADHPHIDGVLARAKKPASFSKKAQTVATDGRLKYPAPLSQIQDQIGARVIVFYLDDVANVAMVLNRYLKSIEEREVVPDSEWKFGYFGQHWIFALPDDVIPADVDLSEVPRFFEMQVKTLYQHAWSEANHDLAYKALQELTPGQQRRFAYTSAQSWGADRVFEELRRELDEVSEGGEEPCS
jgi:ppGpp synthetase/RelA/SpoT-type nucleotidyltranferase